MPAPQLVLDLVDRFHQQIDAYKSGSYNETQLRREFLDPLFKALGWDVDNTSGYAETLFSLNRQFASAKTAHEKTALQRKIDATDRQIDNLVYELYGLTDDEIKIVEEGR